MKVCKLKISNFRGIMSAELKFTNHLVLIGDNNTGKSTILEALDLVLGPERMGKRPVVDEHDFYNGKYIGADGNPEIVIEATICDLDEEQERHFKDEIEFWDKRTNAMYGKPPVAGVDDKHVVSSIRITFIGKYDKEEDDFVGETYFSQSVETETFLRFGKTDKRFCGFLYLRSLRTGHRALSMEKGSLLDIILRLKDVRPQMWEKTIKELSGFEVATAPEVGITEILKSIEAAMKQYVPREWGSAPHLKVSNLTREHLRKTITAFVATGEGDHAAPFYRQGTGTINILVLAMLTIIAEGKQNVIFAMEEPETAIPPYAQKRIIDAVRKLSSQSIFTSHSPFVLEEFGLNETVVLSRNDKGIVTQSEIELPASVKHKAYRQNFRSKFCESLLSRRVLIAEGATETACLPTVARRLSFLNGATYSSLEALGICTMDAQSDSQIADMGTLYSSLGKDVYAVCDHQEALQEAKIRSAVKELYMHSEHGFEDMVIKNTTNEALVRFCKSLDWPSHLLKTYPDPSANVEKALSEYFSWSKGNWGMSDFLAQCTEKEIPQWLKATCLDLKKKCEEEIK